mmetsp:Transcript_889/g.1102  ORF Transcript_889/g.1102 Transcript_889/m.1102 type:complete len:246 (-) Transcript_889:1081-1818(-)
MGILKYVFGTSTSKSTNSSSGVQNEHASTIGESKRRMSGRRKTKTARAAADSSPESDEGSYDLDELTLEERDKEILRTLGNYNPKLIRFFGDIRLLPNKAQNFFGDLEMPLNQVLAQRQAEKNERIRIYEECVKRRKRVINQKPSVEQLALPFAYKNEGKIVSEKALRLLGDEILSTEARKVLTPQMRKNITHKTLTFFGDSFLLTPKQQQLLGEDPFTPMNVHYDHKPTSSSCYKGKPIQLIHV